MTRTDYLFLGLILAGLAMGLAYFWLVWGWHNALAVAAATCVFAGVVGGLRK